MSNDAIRWDEKYRNRIHVESLDPDPLLVEYQELFQPGQQVVDLASGSGRHSLLLAARGCFVIPIDCSRIALQHCCNHATNQSLKVYPIVADLIEIWFPPESLNAVICFNYLERTIFDNICKALKPGGIFVMKTFNQNFLKSKPRFNSDYVLKPGELAAMFAALEIIHLNDDCKDWTETASSIVAIKP